MFIKPLNRRRDEDGFTLIELLVVVVILGILIGIAIPVYLNYRKSANDKAAQSDLRNAVATLEVCNSENGAYPTSVTTNADNGACTGQRINVSTNTTVAYTGTATAYSMVSNNSGGSGKWYCYNSTKGGSVAALSPNPATEAAAKTACAA